MGIIAPKHLPSPYAETNEITKQVTLNQHDSITYSFWTSTAYEIYMYKIFKDL